MKVCLNPEKRIYTNMVEDIEVYGTPLTRSEEKALADKYGKSDSYQEKRAQAILKDWPGLTDENKQDIPFSKENVAALFEVEPGLVLRMVESLYDMKNRTLASERKN